MLGWCLSLNSSDAKKFYIINNSKLVKCFWFAQNWDQCNLCVQVHSLRTWIMHQFTTAQPKYKMKQTSFVSRSYSLILRNTLSWNGDIRIKYMIMKNHRSGNAYKNLKPINPGSLYSQSTSANFSDIPHGQRKDFPSIKKKKKNSSRRAQLSWKGYDKKWEAIKFSPISNSDVLWGAVGVSPWPASTLL